MQSRSVLRVRVLDVIKGLNCDVLCLQEVDEFSEFWLGREFWLGHLTRNGYDLAYAPRG